MSTSENEEICLGEINNCIRFRFSARDNIVSVVANTSAGYVSANILGNIKTTNTPWSGGVFLSTDSGLKINLTASDLFVVKEWLEKHGVTLIDGEQN